MASKRSGVHFSQAALRPSLHSAVVQSRARAEDMQWSAVTATANRAFGLQQSPVRLGKSYAGVTVAAQIFNTG